MRIGGFLKLTLLDFPGRLACIVFTKGCNFRCPFCQNSQLISGATDEEEDAFLQGDVLSYLEKRKGILEGVVVSGGEPLLQEGLSPFLARVKEMGYQVKLDTNGSFPDLLQGLLDDGLIDYVAMDVKHIPDKYDLASGISREFMVPRIRQSLQVLKSARIPFELRTTVVKGIHTKEDVMGIAKWLSDFWGSGEKCPFYLQSYENSKGVFAPDGLASFSKEELEEILILCRKYYSEVKIRS